MSGLGTAGRKGDRVRSDCWVSIELRDGGPLELDVTTRVEAMYGDSIRSFVRDVLAEMGVHHAKVSIEDYGALPYVIAARLEAAVKRADPLNTNTWLPEALPCTQYPTEKERFRRSRLYLPGGEPKFFTNAGLHGADGYILDLEDSVPPSEKDSARLVVRNALRQVDFGSAERMVRINQLPLGLEDIRAIAPHNVHVVLIPKCESAEQVREVDEAMRESGASETYLMPIIESALGAFRAYEIASACRSVCSLAIGLEDYTADIGAERTPEGRESFWARSQVVNGARAAGVQPIDTVFSDVDDEEGLRASVREAKALGFEGKGCIHPRQIRPIHEEFAPSPESVEKAKRIVTAYEDAAAKGLGVVALGSKMIDPPVVKRALRTVKLAVECGLLPENWRETANE
ncbi:MAG: citrate lyase subunit gamma [Fimbriimonadia bacterium]